MSYNGHLVIDADCHIREYADLDRTFRDNIDPRYREAYERLSEAVDHVTVTGDLTRHVPDAAGPACRSEGGAFVRADFCSPVAAADGNLSDHPRAMRFGSLRSTSEVLKGSAVAGWSAVPENLDGLPVRATKAGVGPASGPPSRTTKNPGMIPFAAGG